MSIKVGLKFLFKEAKKTLSSLEKLKCLTIQWLVSQMDATKELCSYKT